MSFFNLFLIFKAMIINWFGQACFKIQGDKTVLVTDPFAAAYGLKVPRLAADIVTVSHDHADHNNIAAVRAVTGDQPFIINQPGEYEIKNTFVYGISAFHDDEEGIERGPNIIYRIEMDGITLVHLGDLGHALTNGQIEKLEGTDILLIPIGGVYTIDTAQATKLISQLEPRIVIPMHYQIPGLKIGKKIEGVEKFCKEMGVKASESLDKLKISKKDLPPEDLKVIILQA